VQGTVVNNRYSIVHTLGGGGMAKVYLIHQPEAREAGLVGGPGDLRQLRSDRIGGVGPSETRNLQSYPGLFTKAEFCR
jgi:hypothetical protein